VKPGIDSRWNSHVSVGKTALDLLGLPPLGLARLDDAVSLADLVRPAATVPPPPAFGAAINQPAPPTPTPTPAPTHPPPPQRPSARSPCATAAPCPQPTTNPSNSAPEPGRSQPARAAVPATRCFIDGQP
jgi:hypothetical protein